MSITVITSHGAVKAYIDATGVKAVDCFERWLKLKYGAYCQAMENLVNCEIMSFDQWRRQSSFQLVRVQEWHNEAYTESLVEIVKDENQLDLWRNIL